MPSTGPRSPPYELRFEWRGDYLRAEVNGPEDSVEITLAYWREIAAECERRDADRLLVIDRLRGRPATPEELAQYVRALHDSYLKRVRIAFFEPESTNLPLIEHAELAAYEIGTRLRVFGSEREAEIWLRYGAR